MPLTCKIKLQGRGNLAGGVLGSGPGGHSVRGLAMKLPSCAILLAGKHGESSLINSETRLPVGQQDHARGGGGSMGVGGALRSKGMGAEPLWS